VVSGLWVDVGIRSDSAGVRSRLSVHWQGIWGEAGQSHLLEAGPW
jgi:hypothetical protein